MCYLFFRGHIQGRAVSTGNYLAEVVRVFSSYSMECKVSNTVLNFCTWNCLYCDLITTANGAAGARKAAYLDPENPLFSAKKKQSKIILTECGLVFFCFVFLGGVPSTTLSKDT